MISLVCVGGRVWVLIKHPQITPITQNPCNLWIAFWPLRYNAQQPTLGEALMIRPQLDEFMRRMAPKSVAIIPGAHDTRRSNDTLFVRPRDPEREIWDGRRAGVEGAKSEFGAHESFPVEEFGAKLSEYLDGADLLYYRLGVDRELDDVIIKEISRMRSSNRKPIHPPQTIVDPATIVHEMRVVKSADEVEIMQTAADIAA